jgi:hypothetical protein
MEDDVEKSNTSRAGQGESEGATGPETIEAEVSPKFRIECPLRPKRRMKGRRLSVPKIQDNVYVGEDAPVLAPKLRIEYGVRPGKEWEKLSTYKNAKRKCEHSPNAQSLIAVF